MWRNALFATAATLMGIALAIFASIDFLIPYKRLLLHYHGRDMAIYAGLLTVNLFALYFLVTRKLLLKNTGERLSHVAKELRDGRLSLELSDRLRTHE